MTSNEIHTEVIVIVLCLNICLSVKNNICEYYGNQRENRTCIATKCLPIIGISTEFSVKNNKIEGN